MELCWGRAAQKKSYEYVRPLFASTCDKLTHQDYPLVMTCNKIFRPQNKIELSFAHLLKMYGSCSLEAGQRFSHQLIKLALPSLLVSLPPRIGAI